MGTQRTFTAEETRKKFDALPPEVKEILYSPEMSAAIQKVGEKNKLHYDQMGRLEMETTNVLLGFTETADYPGILEKVLGVDAGAATAIAKDVNDILFVKIRESMKHSDAAVSKTDMAGKSVVMPSAAKVLAPAVTTPVPAPAPTAKAPTPVPVPTAAPINTPTQTSAPAVPSIAATPVPPTPKPATTSMQHVDAMLSAPMVSMAPKPAVAPGAPINPPQAAKPATPAPAVPDVKKSDAPAPPPIYKTDPYHEPVD